MANTRAQAARNAWREGLDEGWMPTSPLPSGWSSRGAVVGFGIVTLALVIAVTLLLPNPVERLLPFAIWAAAAAVFVSLVAVRRLGHIWVRVGGWGAIVLTAWLIAVTGGSQSVFVDLYLITLLYVALFRPARGVLVYGGAVVVAALWPLVYDAAAGGEFVTRLVVRILVWTLLAILVNRLVRRGRASEQRYRSLFKYNPDAVYALNLEGRFTTANPATERLTGMSEDELAGSSYIPLVVEEQRDTLRALVIDAAAGKPQTYQTAITTRDGRRVELLVANMPIVVDDRLVGVFGIAKDLTDRIAAEAAVRRSETLYRTLVEQIPVISYIESVDGVGPAQFISPQVQELLGYPLADWFHPQGLWREIVHPEDRDRVLDRWAVSRRGGTPFSAEYRFLASDGAQVWVRDEAVLVRDDDGQPLFWQGILIDIGEQRRTSAELRARAAQQAAVAALGERALAGADLDELFQEAVRAVAKTLDVRWSAICEAAADRSALVLRAVEGVEQPPIGTLRLAADERSHAGEAFVRRSPVVVGDVARTSYDTLRFAVNAGVVSGAAVPIGELDHPFGALTAYADEPERFTEEDVNFLQSMANVLSNAVTRRRTESRLLQAQKLEAVGRFAGGIAHDFNNLLTAIVGYLDMLHPVTAGNVEAERHLREAVEAGHRAGALIEQLLTFSRGQLGPTQPSDVAAVVQGLEPTLRRLAGDGIDLVWQPPTRPVAVPVNAHQLEQVVINLVVNARDAMPDGGRLVVSVTTGQDPDDPGTPCAMLTVEDTGTGMSADVASNMFEPFFTTKSDGHGTGLGLAIVYGVVTGVGGRVHVDTAPGQGTTVTAWMPLADELEAVVMLATASPPGSPSPGDGGTVLVVEDRDVVRRLVVEILTRQGYQVLEAPDGAQALTLTSGREHEIDVIVTDVVMPELSGPELVTRLRAARPELATVFISGFHDRTQTRDLVAQHGMQSRATRFLQKPFGLDALVSAVREVRAAADSGTGDQP